MLRLTRRSFLAASAAAAVSAKPFSRVLGANDDLRIVVIGLNNIGRTHLMNFPHIPGVRVTGACDVDSDVLDQRMAEFRSKHGGNLKRYEDLRAVFDDREVDAVVLGVPNHWHALATVWGCQAGKDVYVEKPCSYDMWEATQMQAAADKYGRIVQVGIQRRSFPHLADWFQQLQQGALGKIRSVHGLYYARRESIGPASGPRQPPAQVNHDLWSGPAPTEILREKYHYDWHWFWPQGNGELGNNGPHVLDLARWAIGAEEFPRSVTSLGGRYAWNDAGKTPNTHIVQLDYEPAPIVFEIRNFPVRPGVREMPTYRGINVGIIVDCENGSYVGFDEGKVYDPDGNVIREITGPKGGDSGRQFHRENFVKAVRSRNTAELNCPIRGGQLSSGLCHLGNISHRLGETIPLAAAGERIQDRPLLKESYDRMVGFLGNNDVPVASATVSLGPTLLFDPRSERFLDSSAANDLMKREYRKPFVLPESV